MKKVILMFFLCCITCKNFAQLTRADSLEQHLSKMSDLKERYRILNEINTEYYRIGSGKDPRKNNFEMIRIALQLNDNQKIAQSYNGIGDYYCFLKGDNTTALDYLFKAIPYAEKLKNDRCLSSIYCDIAIAYNELGNYDEQFRNLRKAEASLPDTLHPEHFYLKMQIYCNYASYYTTTKKIANAIQYIKVSAAINEKLKYPTWDLYIKTMQAYYYTEVGNKDSARFYFNMALALDKKIDFVFAHTRLLYCYTRFLIGNHEFAEAKLQAFRQMYISAQNNNNSLQLQGVENLKQIYDKEGKVDSAYYFAEQAMSLKDSVLNQTIQNKVQALNFTEEIRKKEEEKERRQQIQSILAFAVIAVIAIIALILFITGRQRKRANAVLQKTLSYLKATQTQLIQSEKMASLGELTAGIAHEIQNPLNFVNNFSEVSNEMIDEMREELATGNIQLANEIAIDIKQNLEKINHHGKRADAIVKGMLQHSSRGSGKKEPTDINKLADEYLRLAYHGLRAKDNDFNATLKTSYDESIGNLYIIPQDIGRVILNLLTNAFYAVDEKKKSGIDNYEPKVSISTKKTTDKIEISVADNGNGIPQNIVDKIFQPFFTTKPTGQGTGLGLSLAYDIVKAHGGDLKVETKEGEGTTFIITLIQ